MFLTLHFYVVRCRPDDGRSTTETCCLNECNMGLPVTRILVKQLYGGGERCAQGSGWET